MRWLPLLLLAGCVRPDPTPTAVATAQTAPVAPWTAPEPPSEARILGDAPTVLLLQPGAEPRAPLRYGDGPQVVTLMLGWDGRTVAPDLREGHTWRVLCDLRFEQRGADVIATVDRVEVKANNTAVPSKEEVAGFEGFLRGRALTLAVDDRGRLAGVQLGDVPPALWVAAEDFLHGLASLFVPLPEEPVGVGAKWQAVASDTWFGARRRLITDVHWTEGGPDAPVLAIQRVDTMAIPQDLRFEPRVVDRYEGGAKGTATLGASERVPVAFDLKTGRQVSFHRGVDERVGISRRDDRVAIGDVPGPARLPELSPGAAEKPEGVTLDPSRLPPKEAVEGTQPAPPADAAPIKPPRGR